MNDARFRLQEDENPSSYLEDKRTGFSILPDVLSAEPLLQTAVNTYEGSAMSLVSTTPAYRGQAKEDYAPAVRMSVADSRKATVKAERRSKSKARIEPIASKDAGGGMVTFSGSFGSIQSPCEDVFVDGQCLVIVNDPGSFCYIPPVMEESIMITTRSDKYVAYSVGVSFELPGLDKRVTVLILEM